ncbi:MAG: flagellar type III secretion system pore protein FliP, partial [Lentisphaeria bacterium]|nr:flagellar type III secretion system pore protein FliP [Lentisphaeria bacterium]
MSFRTSSRLALPTLLLAATAGAQSIALDAQQASLSLNLGGGGNFSRSVGIFLLVTALSLVPSFVVMMTSFTRIVVVLGFLRQAMGTQNSPSGRIISGLALFLTVFIMQPVWNEVYQEAVVPFSESRMTEREALERAAVPIKRFMLAQTRERTLVMFMDLAQHEPVAGPADLPMTVIIPAFMVSELQTAFQMGFLIFLPFLVIDIVTATFLMAMGMMMLPPMMISLPFKLLLFIIADGWNLLVEGLIR